MWEVILVNAISIIAIISLVIVGYRLMLAYEADQQAKWESENRKQD